MTKTTTPKTTMAFPHALGTGLLIQSPLDPDAVGGSPSLAHGGSDAHGDGLPHGITNYDVIDILIDEYEQTLSRFRARSLVSEMREAEHGGSFDFPDWAGPLFDLYDKLAYATDDAIDPCVGEDLIQLGYDARYSFRLDSGVTGQAETAASQWELGAEHGRATWREDVERHGTTLITRRPVALDFGACGKGYLVDLIAQRMFSGQSSSSSTPDSGTASSSGIPFVIDAGGDLLIRSPERHLTIALEDPKNSCDAVGTATVSTGAFCASSPSRRHWEAAGYQLHHLLNAIDGRPVNDVAATWVYVPTDESISVAQNHHARHDDGYGPIPASYPYPTAFADGLATALFVTPANQLHDRLADYAAFDCAVLNADRSAAQSDGFPGEFFVV